MITKRPSAMLTIAPKRIWSRTAGGEKLGPHAARCGPFRFYSWPELLSHSASMA